MCGLSAIISKEPTTFDVNHFNILGTLNDERGGDSCGIWIDGKVEYGIGDKSYFRDFTYKRKYPKKASIAFLHCRKTSVGNITNLSQCHPVVINTKKGKFVLMHNGTITNAETLAKKYIPNLNTTGMSDTQIMAHIMCHHGYDVLSEYEGTAVFVIADYRFDVPKVFLFKGSSCYNEAGSKSERPLVYITHDGKFYCSSMFSSLMCISHKATIYEVPTNKLLVVDDQQLFVVKEFDRSKLTKKTYSSHSWSMPNYKNNKIWYSKKDGLYYNDDLVAHGVFSLYPSGYMVNTYYSSYVDYKDSYFFYGRLVYNKQCFDFLEGLVDLIDDDVLVKNCPEIIDYFSVTPAVIDDLYYRVDDNFNYVLLDEVFSFAPPYDTRRYYLNNGVCENDTYEYAQSTYSGYKDLIKDVKFDFDSLEKKAYELLVSHITINESI